MNKKFYCFVRTLRRTQACLYSGSSLSRAASRTLASEINGYRRPPPSIGLKQCQLLASPSWQHLSLGHFSQDARPMNAESANSNDEKIANSLLDEHEPVTLGNAQPSDLLISRQQGSSEAEGQEKESMPQQFFAELQRCTSPTDVLDLVSKYPVFRKHVSNCFSAMWVLTKKLSLRQKGYEKSLMFEHPAFSHLCQTLIHEAKFMCRDDLAYSMLAVVRLEIPEDTQLVQTLLRICQERLNEFNDRCLSVLASALAEMGSSKNVEALRYGIQLLVDQRLTETSDVFILQTYMKCIGKGAPLKLKIKLENKLFSNMEKFSVPNAQHMFNVLAEMKYRSIPILNTCSEKVIDNIQGIPFKNMLKILISCFELRYQNITLYSAIGDYAASVFYMLETKQVVLLLCAFKNLCFRPVDLMDAFAEKLMADPESLNMKHIIAIVDCYCSLNHFPKGQKKKFLETLDTFLNNCLSRLSNTELLRVVSAFCTAGYIPQHAVDQLLQDEIVCDLISDEQKSELHKKMLWNINVCLQLDGNSCVKQAALLEPPLHHPVYIPVVENALATLLGDPSLYQQDVEVSHGYSIDFQILMDADRKTVLPRSEGDRLTDDPNIKRIALLFPRASSFCKGPTHPRSLLAMKMRHLHLLGHQVILVPYSEFEKMTPEEAVKFLKGKLFSAEGCSFSK
ncbi:hypothetical protein JRQ81_001368 [Phrynocephalus forsythii]|uniref:RAP domain-containing protein n=1 Tax=Phrynocephalus forsythii TaxID=171643 RepID=A0A9Q0YBY9_9SAUR|nr:hypothetical protein JRQ81_001368 [Phrynocephalus forsythii]